MRFGVSIGVLTDDFAFQQTAIAHLFGTCPDADLEQVEVLMRPSETRLAHHFRSGDIDLAQETPGTTIMLTFPGAEVPLLAATGRLRPRGRFPGTITRAPES